MMESVLIVVRTKDRPILLSRALVDIQNQNFHSFKVVVVNDGGNPDEVDRSLSIVDATFRQRIIVDHIPQSVGLETASNRGIRQSDSKYIIIHDDDDTWEQGFLHKCVSFLDAHEEYLGVVTRSYKVVEKITDDKVEILEKTYFNPGLTALDIGSIAMRNEFPPISFLFRRTAYDCVDGFDETLFLLGDWDFNLRVLLNGDIGVIPEYLTNYHHRFELAEGHESYGNTVTTGISRHFEWEARYRNLKLREDIRKGVSGLGFVLVYGKQTSILLRELERLRRTTDRWEAKYKLSRKSTLRRILRKLLKK